MTAAPVQILRAGWQKGATRFSIFLRLHCKPRRAAWLALHFALFFALVLPARPQGKSTDLSSRSLDDLMNMEVSSASKKEQKVSRTAAPIFVITQEDIRRSGATKIPDLFDSGLEFQFPGNLHNSALAKRAVFAKFT